MHILTESELLQIHGGHNQTIKDALLVSSGFSWLFGLTGAAVGGAWVLSYPRQTSLIAITALVEGYPAVTLTIALFAGLGAGGCLGSLIGLGLYYGGFVTLRD